MIFLVTKNPKKQRCFFEELKEFDELVDILELIPFYYDIYVTMDQKEANEKFQEWKVKFYDCNSSI